jgi:hypothetical protein
MKLNVSRRKKKGVIEVKEDGTKIKGFPEWKNNYNYKWSELFNALGLEVR